MTEPWEDALDRLERGCERNGKRCINWHTYPYNVCLGCIDDNRFYHHQFSQGTMDAKGTATLRSTIERLTAERDWLIRMRDMLAVMGTDLAVEILGGNGATPEDWLTEAERRLLNLDALCDTRPKEDE